MRLELERELWAWVRNLSGARAAAASFERRGLAVRKEVLATLRKWVREGCWEYSDPCCGNWAPVYLLEHARRCRRTRSEPILDGWPVDGRAPARLGLLAPTVSDGRLPPKHPWHKLCFLASSPYRTEAEEAELWRLRDECELLGLGLPFEPEPREGS